MLELFSYDCYSLRCFLNHIAVITTAVKNHKMFKQLLRLKPLPETNPKHSSEGLLRNITLFQLTLMGVGSTLGTGIFFALAETVPVAGPAVILSFIFAGIAAGLTALCYAEVSSALPVSGSSYTFTYMTMGEGAAMTVAACLLLEWGISAAAVSVGWGSYLNDLISIVSHTQLPLPFRNSPFVEGPDGWKWDGESYVNLPAVILIWMCTMLLLRGSRESAMVNASEETINPQRNIPLAIMGTLIIVTIVYVVDLIMWVRVSEPQRTL
jgi:APA family basic amino acid/polyamine antiporter